MKDPVELLKKYNEEYRKGNTVISDSEYDNLYNSLKLAYPDDEFFQNVESEVMDKERILHLQPMLSTDKAYSTDELKRYIDRVTKAGLELGLTSIRFRVTPKLDGLAGHYDGDILSSRGDGHVGYNISDMKDKGIVLLGNKTGLGEIVLDLNYFNKHLSKIFKHPRNIVVGIASCDMVINERVQKALNGGVVHFVPYSHLDCCELNGEQLLSDIDDIRIKLLGNCNYPTDGLVVEVIDESVKKHMGATSHHHRWQIAVKTIGDVAETKVLDITYQTGRTGVVTPVLELKPVELSGATISRVTAHNFGFMLKAKVGIGSIISIIRSGEVIPKIHNVIIGSDDFGGDKTKYCSSCNTPTVIVDDFLRCPNKQCKGQIEQKLAHWFRTLGNIDWFGIKSIQTLVAGGYDSLEKIYCMTVSDFSDIGFGPVQSVNLYSELLNNKTKPLNDWRFLAAFGIPSLGRGDSRKLLEVVSIDQIFDLTPEFIKTIPGFGEITSKTIVEGIKELEVEIRNMLDFKFNLVPSKMDESLNLVVHHLSGKGIVFTGTMSVSREEMLERIRAFRMVGQSSVSSKTHYLVCGENPGKSKVTKAMKIGIPILTETEFEKLIKGE